MKKIGIGKLPLEQATAEPEPVPDTLKPFAGDDGDEGEDEEPEPEPEAEEPEKATRTKVEHKALKSSFWTEPERKARFLGFNALNSFIEKLIIRIICYKMAYARHVFFECNSIAQHGRIYHFKPALIIRGKTRCTDLQNWRE